MRRCLVLLLALAACGKSQDITKPAPDQDLDQWYIVKIGGARSGFYHQFVRIADGKIHTETEMEMRMKRLGDAMRIAQKFSYEETTDGTPIRFTERRWQSKEEIVVEGTVRNGKLSLVTRLAGNETKKEIDWNPDWKFLAAQDRLVREKAGQVGATFSYSGYSSELGKGTTAHFTVKGNETIKIGNQELNTFHLEQKTDALPGIVTHEWRTPEGRLVKSSVNMMGLEIVQVLSDKQHAIINDQGEIPEVFISTLVKPKQKLGDTRRMTEALYRISMKDGNPDTKVFTFDGQKVESSDKNSLTLRVRFPSAPAGDLKIPIADASVKEFLQPNDMLQCNDAKVVAVAKEAVGDETDAWKAARKIQEWVYQKVSHGDLSVGFASAKEVAEHREGDCTEHSVLAAAMARAVGIPSRVAVGIAYANGAFGGHMWTEVWIGGWIPIDATFGEDSVDAAHIKMGESSLNDGSAGSEFANVLIYLGRMDLDVLEADGKKLD